MSVTLTVTDSASSMRIVHVDLTPEQFTQLMGNTRVSRVVGECSPRLDRVGKRMENDSFGVPRDVPGYGDDAKARVLAWASEQSWASEWEALEPWRTNSGWKVVVRRWVASDPS